MKTAFLFTGQGCQYYGMYEYLVEKFPKAKDTFEEMSRILGYDLIGEYEEKKEAFFEDNEKSQIMMLAYEVAAYRAFTEKYEVEPFVMAGHSLGEIIAITCAGGFSLEQAVHVIQMRGRAMDRCGRNKGTMLAVFDMSLPELEQLCRIVSVGDSYVTVSNINSESQIVVSGNESGIAKIKGILDNMKVKSVRLNVIIPFHSKILKEAAEALKKNLEGYGPVALKVPVVSNIDAGMYKEQKDPSTYLSEHIIHSVSWKQTVSFLVDEGADLFVEFGPKAVLTRMLKTDHKDVTAFSLSKEKDIITLEEDIRVERLSLLDSIISRIVTTKSNVESDELYHEHVIEPYVGLQKKREELKNEKRVISIDELSKISEIADRIIDYKTMGKQRA